MSRQDEVPAVRWTSFTDEAAGFKMDCPDVLRFEHTSYGTYCIGAYGAVIASVTAIESDVGSLEEWLERYRQAADYISPAAVSESTFAGQAALKVKMSWDLTGSPAPGVEAHRYFVLHDGMSYEINHSFDEKTAARFEGGFRFLESY